MLRWQGALAFRLWTGVLPPAEPMRRALAETVS
jgi:shikimate 5-dehydrogenase